MVAAAFEISGWAGSQVHVFEGDSAYDLLSQLQRIQDMNCLVRMGSMMEDAKGKKELKKLEKVLKKYQNDTLTMEDLAGFNVILSVGSFICLEVAEGEEEIQMLKEKYL